MINASDNITDPAFGLNSEQAERRLRALGIRPTAQRVKIAMVVLETPQHVSAEAVLARLNAVDPVVSKATVYNTLGLFSQFGLVRELMVDRTKVFYDSNVSEHFHLYDVDNGELTDIADDQVQVRGPSRLPDGLRLEGLDVIVRVRRARR